jgi:hypothetical protein
MIFIIAGFVLILLGAYSATSKTESASVTGDRTDVLTDSSSASGETGDQASAQDSSSVTATLIPRATVTPILFPTIVGSQQLSYIYSGNAYRDDFIEGQSGWESRYVGQDGAWNGYEQNGYVFRLGNQSKYPGGRRIWDINICCVLPAAYQLDFVANSVTPQRGMLIADLQGDVFDIDASSAVIVLFDIGYRDQLRPAPLRVFELVNGQAYELGCVGYSSLIISSRMAIKLAIAGEYVGITLANPTTNLSANPVCRRVNGGQSSRKLLGIGAVRSVVTQEWDISRLLFESFELREISGLSGDIGQTPQAQYPQVRCVGSYHSSFDDWLEASLYSGCQND